MWGGSRYACLINDNKATRVSGDEPLFHLLRCQREAGFSSAERLPDFVVSSNASILRMRMSMVFCWIAVISFRDVISACSCTLSRLMSELVA